jgi:hypothetical protein
LTISAQAQKNTEPPFVPTWNSLKKSHTPQNPGLTTAIKEGINNLRIILELIRL